MLHYLIAIIILVHGIIHLMGFAHELKFAEEENTLKDNSGYSAKAEKMMSIFWLISYGLFLTTAVLFMLYQPFWWLPAAAGVLLSQVLIILNWEEAKYGSISNIIILFVVIVVKLSGL